MSLDHFILADRRTFQPSERPSYSSLYTHSSRSSEANHSSSLPSWNSQWIVPGWSSPPSSSSIPYSSATCSGYRHPASIDHHGDYHQPSQRSIIPSSQPSLAACLSSPSPPYSRHHPNHPRSINSSFNSPWVAGGGLYAVDNTDASNSELTPKCTSSATSPSPRPPSSTTSSALSKRELQKSDQEDPVGSDCFVMEFSGSASAQASSSLAPPTEVPLRATQASKAMRRMMGVFRLNPFSMHDSSIQSTTTWTGEEAGPLEEEPQMFEFQLHVPGCEESTCESESAPSPALLSVGENEVESNTADIAWAEGSHMLSSQYQTTPSTWFDSDSPQSHTLPALRPYSPQHIPNSPSLSSVSSRRTPLDMAVSDVTDWLFKGGVRPR